MPGILYDGWTLAYQPNSPAALHLLALLTQHPAEIQAIVALPAPSFHPLPSQVSTLQVAVPLTASGLLDWEQRRLPHLARQAGAGLLHAFSTRLPLFTSLPALVSLAGFVSERLVMPLPEAWQGLPARLADALGQGGLSRARGLLWPEGWPALPEHDLPALRLPVPLPPGFGPAEAAEPLSDAQRRALDLPESFVLYHGPGGEADLRRLLAAWSWAAGAIGADYPLRLAGLSVSARRRLPGLLAEYQLADSVQSLPDLPLPTLAQVYQHSSVVFHPASLSPWGCPVRLALACALPVVALETPAADALVGPAAYLVPPGEHSARGLGAALVTVVVEEKVAGGLSQAARQRSEPWRSVDFSAAYAALLGRWLA